MGKEKVFSANTEILSEIENSQANLKRQLPVEFEKEDREIVEYILKDTDKKLSMVSPQRLAATISACKYAVANGLEGDFVECGVWRGGSSMAAKLTFERLGSSKKVYLFDTFAGMTAPTEFDWDAHTNQSAQTRFDQSQKADHNSWCFASLPEVEGYFKEVGIDMDGVRFVKGDVLQTLKDEANLPEKICNLRLDTDWYESTLEELNVLYPRLVRTGSLLIDDYGHWDGARRAVEEYFETNGNRPLLHYSDYTGRMGVKVA